MRPIDRIPGLAAIALLSGMLAAIVVQDWFPGLPLGLFNAGRGGYALLAAACALALAAALAILGWEQVRGRPLRVAGTVRGLLFSALLLEGLVAVCDLTAASRSPDAPLGGPYWERHGAGGDWIFLKKANAVSPLGFRTGRAYEPQIERPRILFAGDSYVEGSGSEIATNYPTVVEARLRDVHGRDVEVMNAGVAGYGPRDARALVDWLIAEKWRVDAIVYHVFLENDFTDNLPGTARRVVAGMNDRFPESDWLRALHPLNSRAFRYALFLWRMRGAAGAEALVARSEPESEAGVPPLAPVGAEAPVAPALRALVERRLAGSARAASHPEGRAAVSDSIRAMRRTAAELGVPFVLVVFPDRVVGDPDLAERMGIAPQRLEPLAELHATVVRSAGDDPVLDTTGLLRARSGMYRPGDTHLSDRGNREVGVWVADALAERLRLGSGGP